MILPAIYALKFKISKTDEFVSQKGADLSRKNNNLHFELIKVQKKLLFQLYLEF